VRIRFDYDVTRAVDGSLSASGHTVHAAIDAAGKPCRLPPRVRELFV
jgi:acyl-CoA thioesterase FadM